VLTVVLEGEMESCSDKSFLLLKFVKNCSPMILEESLLIIILFMYSSEANVIDLVFKYAVWFGFDEIFVFCIVVKSKNLKPGLFAIKGSNANSIFDIFESALTSNFALVELKVPKLVKSYFRLMLKIVFCRFLRKFEFSDILKILFSVISIILISEGGSKNKLSVEYELIFSLHDMHK